MRRPAFLVLSVTAVSCNIKTKTKTPSTKKKKKNKRKRYVYCIDAQLALGGACANLCQKGADGCSSFSMTSEQWCVHTECSVVTPLVPEYLGVGASATVNTLKQTIACAVKPWDSRQSQIAACDAGNCGALSMHLAELSSTFRTSWIISPFSLITASSENTIRTDRTQAKVDSTDSLL